ncbi:MAG: OsmC family protein [Deltaproteobacteria bacterium]|jgi:uncharacterized OsmC-like protein
MAVATMEKMNGVDVSALKQVMKDVAANPDHGKVKFMAATNWLGNGPKSETSISSYEIGGKTVAKDFKILIDEPLELLGTNTAPNAQEVLMAAFNACVLATYVAACAMKGVKIESLRIESDAELDLRGFLGVDESVIPGYPEMHYKVHMKADGSREQLEAIHELVKKTSPNYYNLSKAISLKSELVIE